MRALRSPNGRMLALRPLADIDPSRAASLTSEVTAWMQDSAAHADRLVIDLSDVNDVCAEGLQAIASAISAVHGQGGHVVLTNAVPSVLALLRSSGLDEDFTVHPGPGPGERFTIIDLE